MSSDGPQYPHYPGQEPDESRPGPDSPSPPPPPPPPPGQQWPPTAYGQTTPPPPSEQASKTNDKATWSLILGIVGMLCCGFFAGIPAIILAVQAKREIEMSGGQQSGGGMATAGLVLGIISSLLYGLLGLLMVIGLAAGPMPS